MRTFLLTALVCATVSACVSVPPSPRTGWGTIRVVENAYQDPLRIYAVVGGQRLRIGDLPPRRAGTIRVPASFIRPGHLKIMICPVTRQQGWYVTGLYLGTLTTPELTIYHTLTASLHG